MGINARSPRLQHVLHSGSRRTRLGGLDITTGEAEIHELTGSDLLRIQASKLHLGRAEVAGELTAIPRLWLRLLPMWHGSSWRYASLFLPVLGTRSRSCFDAGLHRICLLGQSLAAEDQGSRDELPGLPAYTHHVGQISNLTASGSRRLGQGGRDLHRGPDGQANFTAETQPLVAKIMNAHGGLSGGNAIAQHSRQRLEMAGYQAPLVQMQNFACGPAYRMLSPAGGRDCSCWPEFTKRIGHVFIPGARGTKEEVAPKR